jgi:hypothetical protein
MVKEIVKDTNVLTQKSEKVELNEAIEIVIDLLDTANHHADHCGFCFSLGCNKWI